MRRRLARRFVVATVGLLLTGADPMVAGPESVCQRVVDDDAKPTERAASSASEREGAAFVGSNPRMLRPWQRSPKRVRDVRPTYPELPPGTRSSGIWIGEILLDTQAESEPHLDHSPSSARTAVSRLQQRYPRCGSAVAIRAVCR